MSNHAVVGVFRQHVFARRSSRRYAPPIPEEHDFYCVKRTPDRVMVQIFHDGNEVYRCILYLLPIINGRKTMKRLFSAWASA